MTKVNNIWKSFETIKEPLLSFHYDRPYYSESKIEGLFKWGALDSSVPNNLLRPTNPIKIGVITTSGKKEIVLKYLDRLNHSIEIKDLYLKSYKGFREIYGLKYDIEFCDCIDDKSILSAKSETELLDIYLKRISLAKAKHEFDVLVILIPSEAEKFTEIKTEDYYFHLHDQIKLFSSTNLIRTQIIKETRIPDRNNTKESLRHVWWLSGVLYTKASGVLYRLAEFDERILYVGISYAISTIQSSNKILIGVAELFDESGNNIRIDLFATSNFTLYSKNPYLSEDASRNIFQHVLDIYRSAKMKSPSKIVVHKNTPFNTDELNGINQAFSSINHIELIHIQKVNPFLAIRLRDNSNDAHNYPILRGTTVKIDDNSLLLWTSGSIIRPNDKGVLNYYQEGRHIPAPLLITRYMGRDSIREVATDILKLTKMNWNNLQFYNQLPATIDYASKIARITKQARDFNPKLLPNDFRYYI